MRRFVHQGRTLSGIKIMVTLFYLWSCNMNVIIATECGFKYSQRRSHSCDLGFESPTVLKYSTIRTVMLRELKRLSSDGPKIHRNSQICQICYQPSVDSAFYTVARLCKRRPANGTQPNFAKL